MSKIDEWKNAKQTREEAENWLNMRNQLCRYDGTNYASRIDVHAKMYMCGQQFVGDKNYHEPPLPLVNEFCHMISEEWLPFAQRAIEKLKEKENKCLVAAKIELEEAQHAMKEL